MDMPSAIAQVMEGQDLSADDMLSVMRLIMSGEATDAQIGGFLVALRLKGETVDEIAAAATVMRELATPVVVDTEGLVDTCGTGGSGSNKFNVSTASAFVAAAAGARVAKHGNRGASSKSGSADVLEAAGAEVVLTPEQVARCIDNVGVGFLFAVSHHGAMKHAIGPHKEIVVRTIFNALTVDEPCWRQAAGSGRVLTSFTRPMAEVLASLGSEHVLVVHSEDGLDEISISAPSNIAELKGGTIHEYRVAPEDFGLPSSPLSELVINDSQESLKMLNKALSGEHVGASNMVALNAGAAIYASGQTHSLQAGVDMAQDAIGSGLAGEKLQDFAAFTRQLVADS